MSAFHPKRTQRSASFGEPLKLTGARACPRSKLYIGRRLQFVCSDPLENEKLIARSVLRAGTLASFVLCKAPDSVRRAGVDCDVQIPMGLLKTGENKLGRYTWSLVVGDCQHPQRWPVEGSKCGQGIKMPRLQPAKARIGSRGVRTHDPLIKRKQWHTGGSNACASRKL